jgi:hypothetical protein
METVSGYIGSEGYFLRNIFFGGKVFEYDPSRKGVKSHRQRAKANRAFLLGQCRKIVFLLSLDIRTGYGYSSQGMKRTQKKKRFLL